MTVRLPYALQKRGGMLLHQQGWLWGQDIRCPDGNVLLRNGFSRVRPPQGMDGSSQYTLLLEGTLRVKLWGFGLFYGKDHGVYLNRYAFAPRHASGQQDTWTARSFLGLEPSQDFVALAQAVQWIAGFEERIQQSMGLAYRERCLAGATKKALPPRELLSAWRHLARELAVFAELQAAPRQQSWTVQRLQQAAPA